MAQTPFSVSNFTSALAGDGARPNLFQVSMILPIIAPANQATGQTLNGRNLSFKAKAAQLPGSTIGTVPLYYMGREMKFAGNRTFADWTVTIINDEDFSIPEDWKPFMELKFKPFKMITQNSYKGLGSRPEVDLESWPSCTCSKETGCKEYCQNKLLFM